ncbi:TatD family deoxyribonuclease [Candidatus Parcubacteria bacterium]|nr:MAG: TatD family deoxyribonuclease [Candidatus Parcubacteria bacterium]
MTFRYFDAHTHPQFVAYDADREEVIKRALEAGVAMNVVGTQKDTSAAAVALAEKYDGVYASIGLHPIHTSRSFHDAQELGEGNKEFTSRGEQLDFDYYKQLGSSEKVIAIGECGLDYYRVDESTKDVQFENFVKQIELANELRKPLMLHIRNAYDDAIELIKSHARVQGDVHFFAGGWGVAKRFLDLGFTLSFTGVVTFTHDYDEVVKNAPLDMILSETDAPYITPTPHRGKRNESMHIPLIVQRIAEIREEDPERVREQLLQNAQRVFSIA